jgi:hypothetical protein
MQTLDTIGMSSRGHRPVSSHPAVLEGVAGDVRHIAEEFSAELDESIDSATPHSGRPAANTHAVPRPTDEYDEIEYAVSPVNPLGSPIVLQRISHSQAGHRRSSLRSSARVCRTCLLLGFEHQQRFARVCGSFGQIDGFAELFEGDRLTLGHAQRASVGELNCPVDRCGPPILRGLGERNSQNPRTVLVS